MARRVWSMIFLISSTLAKRAINLNRSWDIMPSHVLNGIVFFPSMTNSFEYVPHALARFLARMLTSLSKKHPFSHVDTNFFWLLDHRRRSNRSEFTFTHIWRHEPDRSKILNGSGCECVYIFLLAKPIRECVECRDKCNRILFHWKIVFECHLKCDEKRNLNVCRV